MRNSRKLRLTKTFNLSNFEFMYDVFAEVQRIMPIKEERGRVDLIFRIRYEGQGQPTLATFEVSTFLDLRDKTVAQITEEAEKEAQKFAEVLAKTERFIEES